MAKKNAQNNNRNLMIAGGVVVAIVLIYLASSYGGLLGTKSYTGSDGKVATKLTCSAAADGTVSAVLSVANANGNSLSLPSGSVLKGETINWAVPSSDGTVFPASSVTDANGMTQTKVTASSASNATASFNGDVFTVESKSADGSSSFATVTYDSTTCEVPVSGK